MQKNANRPLTYSFVQKYIGPTAHLSFEYNIVACSRGKEPLWRSLEIPREKHGHSRTTDWAPDVDRALPTIIFV